MIVQPFSYLEQKRRGLFVEYLVIGGGGAGGTNYAGGGGAGGYRSGSITLDDGTYPIIVGGPGYSLTVTGTGQNGVDSTFLTVTSAGGGGGAYTSFTTANTGSNGGSGGGGGGARQGTNNSGSGNIPFVDPPQGFNGGNGGTQATNGAPGGGGGATEAGEAGQNNANGKPGDGGDGGVWLDGFYYAGGGGGEAFQSTVGSVGGLGGGGKGTCPSCVPAVTASEGTHYLGGGGGNTRRGGQGVVKIRYAGDPIGTGGIVSQSGGFTYHEFRSIDEFSIGTEPDTTWTPSDFTSVQNWWRADLGVTADGSGNVSRWEDQINNTPFTQSSAGAQPNTGSDATLNNQTTIKCNGTSDFMYVPTAPASLAGSDWTILLVYNWVAARTNGSIFGVNRHDTGVSGRLFFDSVGSVLRYGMQGFGAPSATFRSTNLQNPIQLGATTAVLNYRSDIGFAYGSVSGVNFGLAQTTGTIDQDWGSNVIMQIGASLNSLSNPTVFSSRYTEVNIAEIVIIYGTPSDTELANWTRYVRNRYGLQI